ncbi:PREDICTED: uncharacterized protein LOC108620170 [Drosophila arizonae]|uniref:Uncharacterized protein LOC108620170 n=1 Tax=Drosophila arizonae TaxID=7263 RepID=A0ABM1PZB9_DROAR|nr:PREDICTED: uncharacterized protein LOC108620170 [Drosophila arizonae]
MISIVWLRALRNGNWRHFLNALRDASVHDKFDVNVGVSGTVAVPTLNACEDNRTLSIEVDSENTIIVPAHIWAHVRNVEPALNASDFVVIAHNSPFFTINERNGLCQSMCHEVPWLKKSLFSKLQKYPVYGLVQCCKATDVQNKLDNFPKLSETKKVVQELDDPITTTTTENIISSDATEFE